MTPIPLAAINAAEIANFDAAVREHANACIKHLAKEGVPAPRAHPLVEPP